MKVHVSVDIRRRAARSRPSIMWLVTALVAACGPAPTAEPATAPPPMSSADLSACQGVPAPPPTPPDFGPDTAYLDRIIEPLRTEVMARAPEFVGIGIDRTENIIVIDAPHPTKTMCDDLHQRFGPWIRVRQRESPVLLGGSTPNP